ncbi:hypothetical protein CN202_01830 [Sinorhizobium meliloti]|nr:hypothetical protein CN202_01830 [Sinorhizobium meliloti]
MGSVAAAIWWLGGALACLGGAAWFVRRGDRVQALLLALVAVGLVLNWAGVYPLSMAQASH